jgi:GNAT superfamily N-acetyltransferase
MNLTYVDNYWDNPELKQKFINFLIQIFGLDLSLWDKMGFWDDNFRPFTYFENDRLVSSLCVYSLEMMVAGKPCRVAQVSSVGTLPEYRRQGLNSELTRKALDWAKEKHEFFFLFADKEAYPFYKSCGFRRADEYQLSIPATGKPPIPGAKKLELANDEHLQLICDCAAQRVPISSKLGVLDQKLFLFWCAYFLKENIHYIADLEVLVLCKREQGVLTIFDIVGREIPTFAELYRFVASENDQAVRFEFMIDKLRLDDPTRTKAYDGGLHLIGAFPFEGRKFLFPITAHA